jgi:putative Holliday junction resolvase
MRYLGIDYGRARIGLATSTLGIMAQPFCVIKNRGDKKNIAQIREIMVRAFGSQNTTGCGIIFGLPLYKDGSPSSMSNEIQQFGDLVGRELGVRVEYYNEYLTSVDAEQYIRQILGITKIDKIKELVDAVAGCMILNKYLEVGKGEKKCIK